MIEALLERYHYVAFALLVGIGLYVVIDDEDLVKKVIGLNVFQTGIFLFFISIAVRDGGDPAVVHGHGDPANYVNPLPHVLILTAIVVGVSLTALALALVVRIHEEYGTIREDVVAEVLERD